MKLSILDAQIGMKQLMLIVSLLLVIVSPALAQAPASQAGFVAQTTAQSGVIDSYSIVYTILNEQSVQVDAAFVFETLESPTFGFEVEKARDIKVRDSSGPLDLTIVPLEEGRLRLEIEQRGDKKLFVSFVSDSLIFRSGDLSQFFSQYASSLPVKNLKVEVVLPEGYVSGGFFPESGSTRTDGKHIIASWDLQNPGDTAFSVRFERAEKISMLPFVAIIVLVIALAFVYRHFKKKTERDFLLSFYEDERKVIGYLIKHRVAWQNKVEREYHFSRPKMTRVVKKLEARGLLTKERRGRTNRLTWVKDSKIQSKIAKDYTRKMKKEAEEFEKGQKDGEKAHAEEEKKKKQYEIAKQLLGTEPKMKGRAHGKKKEEREDNEDEKYLNEDEDESEK